MTHPVKPALVILAAGIGSRYGGLKQLAPVGPGGEIIIDYSIHDAIRAGFGRVVFVIRRDLEDAFREVIGSRFDGAIAVDYAYQELDDLPAGFSVPQGRSKPWGTGHALYACRNYVREPFGVINADDFYGPRSFQMLAHALTGVVAPGHHCLIAFSLRRTLSEHGPVSRGICRLESDGTLAGITEHLKVEEYGDEARSFVDGHWIPLTGDEPVSVNMFGFHPTVFSNFEEEFVAFLSTSADAKAEFQLPTVLDRMLAADCAKITVSLSPERWLGVTYAEDKASVADGLRKLIDGGVYPEYLKKQSQTE